MKKLKQIKYWFEALARLLTGLFVMIASALLALIFFFPIIFFAMLSWLFESKKVKT